MKNISLIGFMGSGKTTIGKKLAKDINFLFIDIDNIIEIYTDMKISEIFEKYGEQYFRNIETEVIRKIYKNKNIIFSCGGGVVLRKINMEIIKNNSIVIYLSVAPQTAYERLKDKSDRPLLKVGNMIERINNLIKQREPLYLSYSDYLVETNNKDINQIVNEIRKLIGF